MEKLLFCCFILILIKLFNSNEDIIEDVKIEADVNSSTSKETSELIQNYFNMINKIELDEEEIDKLIFCGTFSEIKIHNEEKIINETIDRLKGNKYLVHDKINNYLLNKCFQAIDLKIAREVVLNGKYLVEINQNLYEKYKSIFSIDYSMLRTKDDLKKTEEETQAGYKVYKAFQILNLRQKREGVKNKNNDKEKTDNKKHKKNKRQINLELFNMPTYIKAIIFLIVFVAIFGGILYIVNSITKKPNKDKKKRKKN